MPELPEVEHGRRLAEATLKGATINDVTCHDDRIVFKDVVPAVFSRKLKERTVEAVKRRGKYIWFELDDRPWPVFHFGMTGAFRSPNRQALQLQRGPKQDPELKDWLPRFTKMHIVATDGQELVMTNARRLGRIRLQDDPERESPIADLGFDPLLNLPSSKEIEERLSNRKAPIKAVLMDQGFAAGVGNWIADEVLYQSKIAPKRHAADLTHDEILRLRQKIKHVIEKAVAVDADKRKYPSTWLFHHRWESNGEVRTSKGEKIEHIRISGRTTAWVPAVQQ